MIQEKEKKDKNVWMIKGRNKEQLRESYFSVFIWQDGT